MSFRCPLKTNVFVENVGMEWVGGGVNGERSRLYSHILQRVGISWCHGCVAFLAICGCAFQTILETRRPRFSIRLWRWRRQQTTRRMRSLYSCVCVFVRVRWCWRARRHRHLLTAQKRFINMRWVDVGRRLYVLCAIVVCRVTIVLFGLWLEVCWVQQCAASPTAGLSSSRNITTPGEGIPYK